MIVLDASALLAWILDEPGSEEVNIALGSGAVIHAVNWAEALTKLQEKGLTPDRVAADLTGIGLLGQTLQVDLGTLEDASMVALLRPLTRSAGLSLGDRYCLALGRRLGLPVLTADRAWTTLNGDHKVVLIR